MLKLTVISQESSQAALIHDIFTFLLTAHLRVTGTLGSSENDSTERIFKMWDLNTLAVRYYVEDPQRAAQHDRAEQTHRERTGSIQSLLEDLMQAFTSAYSPFASKSTSRSQ